MLGLIGLLLIFLFIWEKGSLIFHMTWSQGVLIIVFSSLMAMSRTRVPRVALNEGVEFSSFNTDMDSISHCQKHSTRNCSNLKIQQDVFLKLMSLDS
jgi:hypothetical protein